MQAVVVKELRKAIKGKYILQDINMFLEQGHIYGLIGENGSGKTMLIRLICGLAKPTSGEIYIDGKKMGIDIDVPDSIGAIIEVPGFLPDKSGLENLKYLASLRNRITDDEIRAAMVKCGLDPNNKKHVGKYSLGMRQRLGIAQAIMENPRLLLLDEPMNGLDQQGVKDVKALLKEMKSEGKAILLASHHYEDISELCDIVFAMENGRLYETDFFRIGMSRGRVP